MIEKKCIYDNAFIYGNIKKRHLKNEKQTKRVGTILRFDK